MGRAACCWSHSTLLQCSWTLFLYLLEPQNVLQRSQTLFLLLLEPQNVPATLSQCSWTLFLLLLLLEPQNALATLPDTVSADAGTTERPHNTPRRYFC